MTQIIEITKTDDHYEMAFDGGNAYPVPQNAIDELDGDLTPEEVGESITIEGKYGGHKHAKSFYVEKIIDGLEDDEKEKDGREETAAEETNAEPTPEHVAEVGYHTAAGQAQQIEAQRLFADESDESDDEDDSEKRLMTDGGSTHPREFVECAECRASSETWQKKRQLPQIEQTYECSDCGHEVFVYDASDLNERPLLRFRPVTDGMAMNLRFFGEVGDWPDSALNDLYKQGLERVEAIDYRIVEEEGLSQSEWAEKTDRSQQSVSESVLKARAKLGE